jgi:hypothetical protein
MSVAAVEAWPTFGLGFMSGAAVEAWPTFGLVTCLSAVFALFSADNCHHKP